MADETPDTAPTSKLQKPSVIHSHKVASDRNPDLHSWQTTTLFDGPRSRKEAKYNFIRDRHTGEIHHDAVTIQTVKKARAGEAIDEKHSVTLETKDGVDQIGKFIDFVQAVRSGAVPKETAAFLVVPASCSKGDLEAIQQLAGVSAAGKAEAVAKVARQAIVDPQVFHAIVARAAKDPLVFSETAAVLNIASYREAVNQLEKLIAENASEPRFQSHLTQHPWMFGSEYSELLARRRWTRDEQSDFMVRRTTDGYIEVIEIKTPLGGAELFHHDNSHDSYYAGAELSKVVGQVQKYIEVLDSDRHRIKNDDKEDTNKIRAKVIIGRDGDERQRSSLRRFNGHLHRIEVITFDQLVNIAKNVLRYMENVLNRSNAELAGLLGSEQSF